MVRFCLYVSCLAVSLMSVGCCGPIGPGCNIPMGCSDCDGYGSNNYAPSGPLQGLRNLKRSMVCGSGCGEVYVGEWISTPPDAQDPCCGDQWVGGATKCRPFCWTPGTLLNNLYGSRSCSGAESSAPCGCGYDTCDGGCGFDDIGYADEFMDGGCSSGNCGGGGCATCDARGSGTRSQMARGVPAMDGMTRSASARNMNTHVQRTRR